MPGSCRGGGRGRAFRLPGPRQRARGRGRRQPGLGAAEALAAAGAASPAHFVIQVAAARWPAPARGGSATLSRLGVLRRRRFRRSTPCRPPAAAPLARAPPVRLARVKAGEEPAHWRSGPFASRSLHVAVGGGAVQRRRRHPGRRDVRLRGRGHRHDADRRAVARGQRGPAARSKRPRRPATGIDVDLTGSAGLAGLLLLSRAGQIAPDSDVIVVFSGRAVERAEPRQGPSALWVPGRRALVAGLVLTITLIAFEALAVATVMPTVAHDIPAGRALRLGLLGVHAGEPRRDHRRRLPSDRSGPAPVLAAGLCLFAAGLALAGAAPTMIVLVGARTLQGLGAGAMSATVYVGVARGFPEDVRPKMFALMSTAWVVPGLIGPAIAAGVANATSWRAVFLGLLPLVIMGGALTLPALSRLHASGTRSPDVADNAPPGEQSRPAPVFESLRLAAGTAMFLGGLNAPSPFLVAVLLVAGVAVGLPALRHLRPREPCEQLPDCPAPSPPEVCSTSPSSAPTPTCPSPSAQPGARSRPAGWP